MTPTMPTIQRPAGCCITVPARFPCFPGLRAAHSLLHRPRCEGQDGVSDTAGEGFQSRTRLFALSCGTEDGLRQAPQGVCGEPDHEKPKHRRPVRLGEDLGECAALVDIGAAAQPDEDG